MGMEGGAGLFTSLLGAALKGTAARAQRMEARKIMQKIGEMPPETVAPEMMENQTLARIGAQTGLPSEQYNLAMKNIQRQQMNAIKSAQDRRMVGSLIPGVQQATNDATGKLDAQNAMARMNNQGKLLNANAQIGRRRGEIYRNYLQNYYLPNLNYARALNGAGYQNAISGVEQGVGGIANFIGGMGGGGGSAGGGVGAAASGVGASFLNG